ncbi:hypothetical protein [Paenibacillus sp. FSL K6-1230]|uniref:hypothetical protein n=1 Tax=Paenibacillus sp. FSL K6-1230 TaxID=2921603 RepID=UPI0030F90DD2
MKTLDLNKLEEQPIEVQEAISFYASFTLKKVSVTTKERIKHYAVLERVGLLEPVNP